MGSTSGFNCEVDQGPVVLKTTKLTSVWSVVFRNPSSEALHLGWKSSLILCQDDLDPPARVGGSFYRCMFKQESF